MSAHTLKGFCFDGKGGLELIQKPIRPLKDNEVLLENQAAGLNPVDYKLLDFFGEEQKGQIMGVDGVGIVIDSKHPEIQIGKRYAYHANLSLDGSFATHTIMQGRALFPLDSTPDISSELAASLPCPALTAMQCMAKLPIERENGLSGRNVLILGAGGSVGRILTFLCAKSGAKIWAVCGDRHHKELTNFGAEACFTYDEFKSLCKESKFRNRFFAAFDCAGNIDASLILPLLSYYGHFVGVLDRVQENPTPAFGTCVSLHEIALGAIHSHGQDSDFAILRHQAKILLESIQEYKEILPHLEIIEFSEIPSTLTKAKKENLGKKFVVKIAG